jgi:MerR family transcriptional regulator, thiopeptide resistance regulator
MPYPGVSTEKGAIILASALYSVGEFASRANVTVRTLRYYESVGLLAPAQRTESGYRRYSDADLLLLQQILALKFLGFSLADIRRCLRRDPRDARLVLARQQAMMRDRRRQLDTILVAIEQAQRAVACGPADWQSIVGVIQAIQMNQQTDWVDKYFSEDARRELDELSRGAYSEEARTKLAQRNWTEADQELASERWAHVAAESKRLAEIGADPAGEDAQALAKLKSDLLFEFTQGDPEIEAGLGRFWQNHNALPAEKQPLGSVVPPEVTPGAPNAAAQLLQRAMETYRDRSSGA